MAPLGALHPGSGHAGGAAPSSDRASPVSPSSRLAGRGVWVGSGGVGRPGFAKGRCEPLCPPGAVPVRPPVAGGDSFGWSARGRSGLSFLCYARGGWRLASRFMRSRRSSGHVKAETAGVFRCFDAVHDGVSSPSWRPTACAVGRHGCFSVGQRRYAGYRPDAATAATMMARLVSGSSSSAAMAARVAAFPSPSHHAR